MANSRRIDIYEFADFRLDAAHLLLYRNERQILLAPKVVETLLALVKRHGEVLSKNELMKIVWADSIVEESNLSQNLYLLRRTLGATPDGKPLIETLRRRGYRFNGDVLRVEPEPAENSFADDAQSIALQSSNEEHHYNVERRGNVLTLADWKTNERAETENGDYQSQISEFANAFQACQLARIHYHLLTPPDLIKSRAFLEQAVRLDAEYAPAYVALAEQSVTEAIIGLNQPAECFAAAKNAIRRAAELNANSAEFFAAAGYVALICDWNFVEAERNLRKSLELNAHCAAAANYLGQTLMFQRRFDEAETCLRRAREIEPTNLYHRSTSMIEYFLARDFQKLIEESESALDLFPQFVNAEQMRCWALEQTGRAAEAVAVYQKILAAPHGEFARRWIGYAYALVGDEEKARETARLLQTENRQHYVSPIHPAMLYAGLNEPNEACFYLEKAAAQRDPWLLWIAADARFDNLRSESRFQTLERMIASQADETNYAAPNRKRFRKTESKLQTTAENTDGETQFAGNLSSIVGREKEIAHIKNLLSQNDVRLVTLAGVGGAGKTRLAQAVAQEMAHDFSDGVIFIELAAITNPELVIPTIAQSLGIKESGGKPIFEALKDNLRDKQTLLVVDNFEQVIDAAHQIAELIAATSALKILITSRATLHLTTERKFIVPPLSVPNQTSELSFDEISNYEAIELFIERARKAKLSFTLTNENAEDVAEICAQLDGLPLAIELAAARISILSPRTILAKLENRLKLLTGGASDLPARQQTMRGAIEWSYDLLTEDEKRLFRRLAIFAGGFTFEAAEAVCGNHELQNADYTSNGNQRLKTADQIEVFDLITSLVDKSLLVIKEQANNEQRFQMLETIREYALESLKTVNETEAMQHKHATYFLALAEEASLHLSTLRAGKWLNRLEEEHGNLRGAIRWLFEDDAKKAARLAAAIQNYLINHCYLTEGREWLETALKRGDALPAAVRFKLLSGLGYLAASQGEDDAARKFFEKNLAEGRAASDKRRIAESLRGLGAVTHSQGDYATARKFHEEGLAIHRELNDKFGIAASLSGLGCLALDEGDDVTARMFLEESLTNFRLVGNESGISYCLLNLGAVAYFGGDYETAQKYYSEVLPIVQNLGYKDRIGDSLDGFAALAVKRGELEFAVRLAGAVERLREQIGFKSELTDRQRRNAYLAELKTKVDKTVFAELYEQGRKLKLEEAVALCLKENETARVQTLETKPSKNETVPHSTIQKPTNRKFIYAGLGLCLLVLTAFFARSYSFKTQPTNLSGNSPIETTSSIKFYWAMNEVEQMAFIRERTRYVQTIIGDEAIELDEEALLAIKGQVDDYVRENTSLAQKPFNEDLRIIYDRASRFAPIVRRSFEAREISPALGIYQAMIESEYQDCYESKIGTVGLFLFNKETARHYHLLPNDFCSVEKQSDAAAAYMSDLVSDFDGNKTLALLAFNVGEDGVREYLRQMHARGITQRSAWKIYQNAKDLQPQMSEENLNYVPKFFAAAIIGETPEVFELFTPPLSILRETNK